MSMNNMYLSSHLQVVAPVVAPVVAAADAGETSTRARAPGVVTAVGARAVVVVGEEAVGMIAEDATRTVAGED